jgi:hypothetical protein
LMVWRTRMGCIYSSFPENTGKTRSGLVKVKKAQPQSRRKVVVLSKFVL